MDLIIIESLFFLFFILGIIVYIEGKKNGISLLISLGKRSSIMLLILFIIYNIIIMGKDNV